jgi:hypothetical protein
MRLGEGRGRLFGLCCMRFEDDRGGLRMIAD